MSFLQWMQADKMNCKNDFACHDKEATSEKGNAREMLTNHSPSNFKGVKLNAK